MLLGALGSPNGPLLVLLVLLSALLLTVVFLRGEEDTAFSYGVYVLAAYTTAVTAPRLAAIIKHGRALLHKSPILHRYLTELEWKAAVSLHVSFGINLLYAVYKTAAGLYFQSPWMGAMAFYYIVLSTERFFLLRYLRGRRQSPWQAYKLYRCCGVLLLVLTLAISVMSFYTIEGGHAVQYPGFVIYAAAAYTFYAFGAALVNVVRYRKRSHPIYAASKAISLATALVSMFFLEGAMLAAFGDQDPWQKPMLAGTGLGVFALVAGLSLYMIRRGGQSMAALSSRPRT